MSLSGSAMAQKPTPETQAAANVSKSNNYKVTGVDATAKTFTAIDKGGKAFTFAAPKEKPLPTVGKIYEITYTESPGGGPLQATTVNNSKSNTL